MHFIVIAVCITTILTCYDCLEPVSIAASLAGTAISVGFAGYKFGICKIYECCDKTWINYDYYGLKQDMDSNFFGQHLAKFIILKSVKAHMEKEKHKKALVLSFHGGTGIGKNHVSKIIGKHLYKEGFQSQFVHLYIGTLDFPHHEEVKEYRKKLQKDIENKVKLCERSLFVFDEIDKMPPNFLDILLPYLDYHESVNGVDYRKNIFLFLSNAGAQNISQAALKFFAEGKNREDIKLKDVERLISKGAFNEKGGLQFSDIVKKDLIDVYVPFLPLERNHIKECIKGELRNRHLKANVEEIANEFQYGPDNVEIFALTGCKKVAQKVDLFAY